MCWWRFVVRVFAKAQCFCARALSVGPRLSLFKIRPSAFYDHFGSPLLEKGEKRFQSCVLVPNPHSPLLPPLVSFPASFLSRIPSDLVLRPDSRDQMGGGNAYSLEHLLLLDDHRGDYDVDSSGYVMLPNTCVLTSRRLLEILAQMLIRYPAYRGLMDCWVVATLTLTRICHCWLMPPKIMMPFSVVMLCQIIHVYLLLEAWEPIQYTSLGLHLPLAWVIFLACVF